MTLERFEVGKIPVIGSYDAEAKSYVIDANHDGRTSYSHARNATLTPFNVASTYSGPRTPESWTGEPGVPPIASEWCSTQVCPQQGLPFPASRIPLRQQPSVRWKVPCSVAPSYTSAPTFRTKIKVIGNGAEKCPSKV